ncbi:MAG: hypothetical protein IIT46_12750 [Lachnospiraceae bacterium]|nr:hypothetical protein [Lachnospiraceae bacterium]MBQ5560621.1 hypothetical protein [Lachnospiraceae bacterium]
MNMKNKVLDYIEEKNVSIDILKEKTGLKSEKFERGNDVDWSAEDLLVICAYLDVEPMELYG